MNTEIWKAVEGYEDYYEVSSYGNVRSVDRVVICSDGKKHLRKGRILKPIKDRYGYLRIHLSKSGEEKKVFIHRLVAQAFLPNPNNLPEVNHKDEDKTNNCVFLKKDDSVDLDKSNLEWCTCQYNLTYGTRLKKLSKPVLQINKEKYVIISEYPSANEAARKLKIDQGGISSCCRGKCRTYKGFKWQYKEE